MRTEKVKGVKCERVGEVERESGQYTWILATLV